MRLNPSREGSPKQSESLTIVLKGNFNPALHHPSWYYTIGQFAKDEVAAALQAKDLRVTPTLSRFRAGPFSIDCTPTRWRVRTDNPAARGRILQITTKAFENLLPETQLEEVGFRFVFLLEVSHAQVVDFLSRTMWNLMPVEAQGEVASLLTNTTYAESPRQKRLQLSSRPEAQRAELTVSFLYPLAPEKVFTLRQLSVAEDFELDYDEAQTYAEQLAYTLNNTQAARVDLNN